MVQAGRMFARRSRAPFGGWNGGLGRMLMRTEPIELVTQRHNFLPHRFRWRGSLWRVRQVVGMWDRAATMLTPPRRYFRVCCQDGGEQVVFQDLQVGTWHLSV